VVRPQIRESYHERIWLWIFPATVIASLGSMRYFQRSGKPKAEWAAFFSSAAYLVALLLGAAGALYPVLLPSISDSSRDLTVYNSRAGDYGLRVGMMWWSVGIVLAIAYFVYLYRSVRGKIGDANT